MRCKEEALRGHCKAGMGTKTTRQETDKNQLAGSKSLCRHGAICQHGAIRSRYYLCILKQITLPAVLLLSFYVQEKKYRLCSWFKDPFLPGNYQCHNIWAVIKERNQEGDWESWWPRRIIFTVERPNQDPTEIPRGKPKMDSSSVSFLACGTRSADFLQETEDEWCYWLSVTPSNQHKSTFCFGLFFCLCFCYCCCFWKANWEPLMVT